MMFGIYSENGVLLHETDLLSEARCWVEKYVSDENAGWWYFIIVKDADGQVCNTYDTVSCNWMLSW